MPVQAEPEPLRARKCVVGLERLAHAEGEVAAALHHEDGGRDALQRLDRGARRRERVDAARARRSRPRRGSRRRPDRPARAGASRGSPRSRPTSQAPAGRARSGGSSTTRRPPPPPTGRPRRATSRRRRRRARCPRRRSVASATSGRAASHANSACTSRDLVRPVDADQATGLAVAACVDREHDVALADETHRLRDRARARAVAAEAVEQDRRPASPRPERRSVRHEQGRRERRAVERGDGDVLLRECRRGAGEREERQRGSGDR